MKQFDFQFNRILSKAVKIQDIILTSIKLEKVNNERQLYNPSKTYVEIKKAYKNNSLLGLVTTLNLYCYSTALFYFWPGWFLKSILLILSNVKLEKLNWIKISFSIDKYKNWTKDSLITRFKGSFNFKIIVSVFPFIIGVSYIISYRYKDQVFSYFIQKNLPGGYSSFPQVKWDTFQNIFSQQLGLESLTELTSLDNKKSVLSHNPPSEKSLELAESPKSSLTKVSKKLLPNYQIQNSLKEQTKSKEFLLESQRKSHFQKMIRQVDFYSDVFLVKLNPQWFNKTKRLYVGFFRNQDFIDSKNRFLNPHKNYQIGRNWHFLSSKNDHMVSAFPLMSAFKEKSVTSLKKNWPGKQIGIIPKHSKNFYLNLDELPKKLSSRDNLFPNLSVTETKFNSILPIKFLPSFIDSNSNLFANLNINLSTGKKLEIPINSLEQIDKFNLSIFETNKKNNFKFNQQVKLKTKNISTLLVNNSTMKKEVFSLFLGIFSDQSTVENTNSIVTSINYNNNLNINFKETKNSIDGFFINTSSLPVFQKQQNETVHFSNLTEQPDLCNKSKLLDNELRKYFNQIGIKTLPNLLTSQVNKTTVLSNNKLLEESIKTTFLPKFTNIEKLDDHLNNFISGDLEFLTNLGDYCSKQILISLQDFVPFNINSALQTRKMSGYEYPDTTIRHFRSLLLQHLYKTKISVLKNFLLKLKIPIESKIFRPSFAIQFPPSFTSSVNYNYSNQKIPNLKLKYKRTLLEGEKQTLYDGPGVLRNDPTHDLDFSNKQEINDWIKQFLSSDNPLTNRREVFFGQNLMTLPVLNSELQKEYLDKKTTVLPITNTKISTKLHCEKINKVKKSLKQSGITKTGEISAVIKTSLTHVSLPVLPFTEEFQVPYLTKSQWQTILEKLKAHFEDQIDEKTKLDKKFQVDIPLVRIRNPKQQNIHWPLNQLDYHDLNDLILNSQQKISKEVNKKTSISGLANTYQSISYSQKFSEELKPKISYHYIPSAQVLWNEYLVKKKTFGNVYKKFFTVYDTIIQNPYESFRLPKESKTTKTSFLNTFNTGFYQSWEPITTGSWMMLTQLSFGLVVLQILQQFYRKYGKELIFYLLDLIASLGIIDENLKDELDEDGQKGFRIIHKVSKRFRDIAGIDNILSELGEIVWFLRNSGRSFKIGKIIPKGILLIGAPGTGKTLLVQAIAGEAEVPVLVQSGSSLHDPEKDGEQTLKSLFEQARQLAPCIIFIDEIDALGKKRENIIQNPMGPDEVIELIQQHVDSSNVLKPSIIPKSKIIGNQDQNSFDQQSSLNDETIGTQNSNSINSAELDIMQQSLDKQDAKQDQLSLLMQFLIEMDGLKERKGVIVIGATNRPEVLDLALTRPGRFDQTLHLGLPEKQKRIDILKLYSKNLKTTKDLSWDYLANRTIGFSAADLAAVMNESSMKAVLTESIHTIETIEKGIDSITSYSSNKRILSTKNSLDPFFTSRLAYYQAGKAVVHTYLFNHPSITVLHLWPREKNARQIYINSIIEDKFLKISRKAELEARIIGLYAGKSAELLMLSSNLDPNFKTINNKQWQSDIGVEDLTLATSLAHSMITKWYFYSKSLIINNTNFIASRRNIQEIAELDTIHLISGLTNEIETRAIKKTRKSGLKDNSQKWSIRSWWQTQITHQIRVLDPAYDDWYRIYLPDPEENELNEEWIPPDEYYHNNSNLNDLITNSINSSINWNDIYSNNRDYLSHSLLLTCFNKAFSILDKNREFLDYLASYLIQNEILRDYELKTILSDFNIKTGFNLDTNISRKDALNLSKQKLKETNSFNKVKLALVNNNNQKLSILKTDVENQNVVKSKNVPQKLEVIEKSWGKNSRRKRFRFLTF